MQNTEVRDELGAPILLLFKEACCLAAFTQHYVWIGVHGLLAGRLLSFLVGTYSACSATFTINRRVLLSFQPSSL